MRRRMGIHTASRHESNSASLAPSLSGLTHEIFRGLRSKLARQEEPKGHEAESFQAKPSTRNQGERPS